MAKPRAAEWKTSSSVLKELLRALVTGSGVALLTYAGFAIGLKLTAIGFLYLLYVVATALFFGVWQASLASCLSAACLDYFFAVPLFRFAIADPQDWIALGTFQVTALVISRLSSKELRSSRLAAQHRMEMEQLYELSRNSLLMDLHQAPGPQLVVLIQRIFSTNAVALFDVNLDRTDRAGDWAGGEEDRAKLAFETGHEQDDAPTQTRQRILRTANGAVGALVLRGESSALVADALASLSAIAIDRNQSFEKEERAESARKSEQLRAAVMDALAHEFKTPLTAVQTASSGLLELKGLSDSQNDLVRLIDDEAIRLNALCTRLLQTAKLEARKLDLEMEEVNLKSLIEEVLAESANGRGQERDRVQIAVDDPELTLRVDRGLLATILTQYIDNARKYSTPATPIEIAARRSRTEILISVHNFGPTIPIEDREQIFERFYRSSALKEVAPGTGIGLSIVRKAAEAHHGHVWVISDEKEGTTFFLSLPSSARRKP
jgi:two-component system, OmpR family, sensor histidine kinase KdpD